LEIKTHGESQSDEIGTNGREFIMAVVSAMNVHRTSCESLVCLASYKIESIIRLEEMSTSSFINELRRFMAIRGKVKEFFSDRGTHFIGGAKQHIPRTKAVHTDISKWWTRFESFFR
jgi:hypothetical protein